LINIKLVRSEPDTIRELCRRRGAVVDIDRLLAADEELRSRMTGAKDWRL